MAVKIGNALAPTSRLEPLRQETRPMPNDSGAREYSRHLETGHVYGPRQQFDFILDTVSAPHDLNAYLELLKTDGTMILVGAPDKPAQLGAFPLILKRRRLVGSLIGGIKETQEMLDFCAKHKFGADVEVIPIQQINARLRPPRPRRRTLSLRDRHAIAQNRTRSISPASRTSLQLRAVHILSHLANMVTGCSTQHHLGTMHA